MGRNLGRRLCPGPMPCPGAELHAVGHASLGPVWGSKLGQGSAGCGLAGKGTSAGHPGARVRALSSLCDTGRAAQPHSGTGPFMGSGPRPGTFP